MNIASIIVLLYIKVAKWYGVVRTPGYGFSDEFMCLIFRPIPIIASITMSKAQRINLIPNSCIMIPFFNERCYFLAPFSNKNLVSS